MEEAEKLCKASFELSPHQLFVKTFYLFKHLIILYTLV